MQRLTKQDTALLKGLAITLIVLHNFCHWLPKAVPENEYTFETGRIMQYWGYLTHGGPHIILNFLSHYGHYGVPLFLFLSGYGLVCKYESPQYTSVKISPLRFMYSHACKLWWLMIPAVTAFVGIECWRGTWSHHLDQVVWLATYTSNLQPVRDLILGPWWFFSLIMQLYLIYILILRRWRGRTGNYLLLGLTLLCLAAQSISFCTDWRIDWGQPNLDMFNYMRYNFVGSLLPFAIGIAAARQHNPFNTGWCALTGLVLLLLSATNVWLWFLSPIFMLMATIPLVKLISQANLRKMLQWIGGISATLFAIHPVVRAYTIGIAKMGNTYFALGLYLIISVVAAYALDTLICRIRR